MAESESTCPSASCVRKLEFRDAALTNRLFGPQGAHVTLLSDRCGVEIETRGCTATLSGGAAAVELAAGVLTQLYGLLTEGRSVHPQDVECAWRILLREPGADIRRIFEDTIYVVSPKKTIAPKTLSQRDYVAAIRRSDLVFGIGPAGTGKTYLAVALAVGALMRREVKRIVLARPAVEAGERLGFLPGDVAEKVNPYLRPLYDALYDMLEFARVQDMLASGVIEVAPLAFMRGRTLNDAFVILDEAQNTTPEQMKMFLTRLGFGSRCVVTGDVTQIDLPSQTRSGLIEAHEILQGVAGIGFVQFREEDVIRHPLVGRIVQAYERHERAEKARNVRGSGRERP